MAEAVWGAVQALDSRTKPQQGIDTLYESSTALAAGSLASSGWKRVNEYVGLRGGIKSDVAGTLTLYWSLDASGTVDSYGTVLAAGGNTFKADCRMPWAKLDYQSAGTATQGTMFMGFYGLSAGGR